MQITEKTNNVQLVLDLRPLVLCLFAVTPLDTLRPPNFRFNALWLAAQRFRACTKLTAQSKAERRCAHCALPQSPCAHSFVHSDLLFCGCLRLFNGIEMCEKHKSASLRTSPMKRKRKKQRKAGGIVRKLDVKNRLENGERIGHVCRHLGLAEKN